MRLYELLYKALISSRAGAVVGHVSELCALEPQVTNITGEVARLFSFWNLMLNFSTFEVNMLMAFIILSYDLIKDCAIDSFSLLHEEEF